MEKAELGIQRNRMVIRLPIPLLYLAFSIVFILLMVSILGIEKINLPIATLIFIVVTVLSYKAIYRALSPTAYYTDITFWVLLFTSIDILSLAILALLGLRYAEPEFLISRDITLLSKTILCYALFIGSFILTASIPTRRKESFPPRSRLYSFKIWLLMAMLLTALKSIIDHFVLGIPWIRWGLEPITIKSYTENLFLSQWIRLFTLAQSTAIIFAVATWVIHAPSLKQGRLRLAIIIPISLALLFAFTTERGNILSLAIAVAIFADMVRWKNRFLNKKLIILSVVLLMVANSGTNFLEGYIIAGKMPNVSEWSLSRFFSFHPAPIYVGSTVISWVDEGRVPKLHGSSYIIALKTLIPSQIWGEKLLILDRWFISLFNPIAAELGRGMGFSPVGEGYLNFGILGVILEGIIFGLVVRLIRRLRYNRWLGPLSPFLYAGIVPRASISIYRFGVYIIDGLLLYIVATVGLITLALILFGVARHKGYKKAPGGDIVLNNGSKLSGGMP